MARVRVHAKAADLDALDLRLEADEPVQPGPGEVVVRVRAAGVNPSDVKAALGAMPHAVWPRTPGRDFAGVVTDGPAEWLGAEVWGSGGELGIRRDGSHAATLVVAAESVRRKPSTLSLEEAGAVGVPFVTAYEGFRRAGMPKAGDTVLVLGGNGRVGQAATQIATMLGATVFGVERSGRAYAGHASSAVRMIDASREDVPAIVRAATGGHGADIAYNTVGSPYFDAANAALAVSGRQIFISTLARRVDFDIFAFYRGQHTYVGIDTLALDSVACARVLDWLAPGFESGALRAFPVLEEFIFPLARAREAYRAVLNGSRERVLLRP